MKARDTSPLLESLRAAYTQSPHYRRLHGPYSTVVENGSAVPQVTQRDESNTCCVAPQEENNRAKHILEADGWPGPREPGSDDEHINALNHSAAGEAEAPHVPAPSEPGDTGLATSRSAPSGAPSMAGQELPTDVALGGASLSSAQQPAPAAPVEYSSDLSLEEYESYLAGLMEP